MPNPNPLAIDLFCGLGGWTEGLLAESYDVIGFDVERHEYGHHRYPAQLVVQDVLTLMPIPIRAVKVSGFRFDGSGKSFQTASVEETGRKSVGMNWSDPAKRGQEIARIAGEQAIKNNGGSWFNVAHNTTSGKGRNSDGRKHDGVKCGGDWFGPGNPSAMRNHNSKSPRRKFASAMIAKIPLPLSRHIAATYHPERASRAILAELREA